VSQVFAYLKQLYTSGEYPLHMPGHKRQSFIPFLQNAYALDITEIEGSDNLYEANGILKEAMERAAKVCGADKTLFLVNGSTVGILSAITGLTQKGDTILMARNCHKAVYHAVELRELSVEYVFPNNWENLELAGPVTLEAIQSKIEKNPKIKLVVITSPTYEGVVSPVREIAEYLHEKKIPLLVDEAHGAHFPFSDKFPESAVCAGADVVIQSMHKTLPAFTQSALMHIKEDAPCKDKIQDYLSYYQTSSPSYLFMAGMDACMDRIEKEGESLWNDFFTYREEFMEAVKTLKKIQVLDLNRKIGQLIQDPGKIVISVKNTNISGKELQTRLLKEFKIQLEMAAASYGLAIFTLSDTKEGFLRLAEALDHIDKTIEKKMEQTVTASSQEEYVTCYPIATAKEQSWEEIPLQEAKDRVSAEYINIYPPGIPLIVPGEKMTQSLLDKIIKSIALDLQVQGLFHGKVRVVK